MISPESAYYAGWNTQVCWFMHNYWEKRAQEKITDKEVKITSAEITEAQNNAADFRNVEHITVFLTQFELTDLLDRGSCQMQGTDNFPWVFQTVMKNLKEKLEYIRKCFSDGLIPDITHETYGPDPDVYRPNHLGKAQWSVMKNNLPSDARPEFQKIPVLISGEFLAG